MKTIFLIFQMGKVGSTSIYYGLKDCISNDPDILCFHAHNLSPNGLSILRDMASNGLMIQRSADYFRHQLADTEKLFTLLEEARQKKEPVRIITAVREPIGHAISSVFENLDVVLPLHPLTDLEDTSRYLISALQAMFHEEARNALHSTYIKTFASLMFAARRWLDEELLPVFDIDIYNHAFDTKSGYHIIHHENIQLFIYRFDKLQQAIPALTDFINANTNMPFSMPKTNSGDEKATSKLYKNVRENFTLPTNVLEALFSSRYCQHFFSKEEIEDYIKRYTMLTPLTAA